MSTTSVAPATTWTGADVLYASAGTDGPQATVWTIASRDPQGAPPGPDEIRDIARQHGESVSASAGWSVGEVTVTHAGDLSISTRAMTHADGTAALAAYWALAASVATAVVTAAPGTTADLDHLRSVATDLALAHRPVFSLTAEEVLVLSSIRGLAAPPVEPSAFGSDSGDAVRDAALASARGSLVARGLLSPDGTELVLAPDLGAALDLLLDSEVSLLVGCRDGAESASRLLGGRAGTFAELAPSTPGCLTLSTATAEAFVDRYTRWLVLDGPSVAAPPPLTVSAERLQAAVADAPADGAAGRAGELDDATGKPAAVDGDEDALAQVRRLVSIQGLRRVDGAAAALELVWAVRADGAVWSVKADETRTTRLHLTPADPSSIADGVREALLFSGPSAP